MTTLVVVRKGAQAIIGADTLGTYGDQREPADLIRNASKLVQVGDTWLAMAGHTAMDLVLRDMFRRDDFQCAFNGVREIFATALDMHRLLREVYFLRVEEDKEEAFESSQFNILLANPTGIYGICSKRSVFEYSKFYAFGSGEAYALGAMQAVYDRLDDPLAIARAGLEAAVAFDTGTGAPLEFQAVSLKAPRPG